MRSIRLRVRVQRQTVDGHGAGVGIAENVLQRDGAGIAGLKNLMQKTVQTIQAKHYLSRRINDDSALGVELHVIAPIDEAGFLRQTLHKVATGGCTY